MSLKSELTTAMERSGFKAAWDSLEEEYAALNEVLKPRRQAGLAAAVLKLSEMSEQERNTMGSNGLAVSAREFDRDALIDRLEGWIGQLQGDAMSLSASRGKS